MKTLADFQPLKMREESLLKYCQIGKVVVIADERPTDKTEWNEIRAAFLRWLILTDEVKIDPNGIQFQGAWVSGILDLENVQGLHVLDMKYSVFDETLFFMRSTMKTVYFDGSLFQKGIFADGLICQGNLHLRNGFESKGEVRFVGTKIKGNLDFTQASFKALNEEQNALNCDGIHIDASMFLRENCQIINGSIDFSNARIGILVDDEIFWQQDKLKIELDGFIYWHIHGNTSASFRLENMLSKMLTYSPQPYKQLAKVLRDMGHDRDANEVMIALHDKRLELSKESKWYKAFRKIYKWTSSYGYRPMRTLKIMASIWFLFGCIYWYGANVAVFAPTNPLIFQAPEKYKNCKVDENGTKWLALPKDYNESNNWYITSPAEYTTFQPFWYSLDIILPVVDLKMENDWGILIPSPEGNWKDMIPFTTTNHFIRFLTWVETLAGWGLSLMLVAILSGLAKNEKE